MKISHLTLYNFKSFEGECRIDGLAAVTNKKPIILFGGLNGAGKTSIFEAILLCLYGRENKTLWPSRGTRREDYQAYIASIVNVGARSKQARTEMSIELGLEQVEFGSTHHSIVLKRQWILENGLSEDAGFEITQDGRQIEFISPDEYETFIKNELIPYEFIQFFFFDGEKVQDFVKDGDRDLASSLESVLGIGLYKTLYRDLNDVRKQLLAESNKNRDVELQLREIDNKIKQIQIDIEDSLDQIKQTREEITILDEQIGDLERETRRITRVSTDARDAKLFKKTLLSAEKQRLEAKVYEAIQANLPFIIVAALGESLLEQLEEEQVYKRAKTAQQQVEEKVNKITNALFDGDRPNPPLTKLQEAFYVTKLARVLREQFAVFLNPDLEVLHDLSDAGIEQIQKRFQEFHGTVDELSADLRRLQEIEPELKQIDQVEMRSSDSSSNMLFEQMGQLKERKKAGEQLIVNTQAAIDSKKSELEGLHRSRSALEDKQKVANKVRSEIDYCEKLRSTLDVFSQRLRTQKVNSLEQFTLEMWSQLARKQDQIRRIKIDADDAFSIDLYDSNDRAIDRSKLSAGEKELLAISLIWGLTRLTNRSLPVIIDTPLGRLDADHRARIAAHYFPKASHQVILLSTDTEVIGEEYQAVKPFVSKHYLIEKKTARDTSKVFEGYFSTNV